eukprot:Amastigsp_a681913_11.p3 type:complete len:110 gc:universal Amastigsp_a681913_11:745-416(-)
MGSMRRGAASKNDEYATRRTVGMTCPAARALRVSATVASTRRNLTPRTGSLQSGPSRVAHRNPWTTLCLTDARSVLLTSNARVSSMRAFGPVAASGPKAQSERAASRSH